MDQVPGHDRIVAIPPEANCNVMGSVAGSWQKPHPVVKHVVVAHPFGPPRFHDRKHTIPEMRQRRFGVFSLPKVEFAFGN